MAFGMIAGASARRARWTRADTIVGEITGPSTSMACAIPLANTVFPAPSGPDSTTTSPACSCPPSWAPSAMVSSAVASSAVPDVAGRAAPVPEPPSAMVSHSFAYPKCERDQLGGRGPLDQPDQRVVDDFGRFELHQMSCAADDHQLGLRQRGGHVLRL